MTFTARAVVDALEESECETREALARELTRAALMGARGNSGVILSQMIRGFAEAVAGRTVIDAAAVAAGFGGASDAAYRAVKKPVEGTMLSVIRALAEAAEAPELQQLEPEELLAALVSPGEAALARTQEQLDVLRDAGVVDAGAAGVVELVRGLAAGACGDELPPALEREGLVAAAIHQELSEFRYCTTFVIEGEGLDAQSLERELEVLGDSLLVVGDAAALKVHVHTDDPGAAIQAGTAVGVVGGVEIANMHRQAEEREERLLEVVPAAATQAEVVAVVAGEGNRRLFETLGAAQIVEGGQTMNPSAADLVAAIERAQASEVVVLPNNSNIVMSAEQAAGLAEKTVHVVPSTSIPAGLAALVAFDPERSAEESAAEMREALAGVVTGAVTVASRDAEVDGISVGAGEYLGLVDGKAVATGAEFADVARAVCERLLAEPRDVLTLLTGADEPPLDGVLDALREQHPELELAVHAGGQPHYPLLLSAE